MMFLASSGLMALNKVGRDKFAVSICCSLAFVVIEQPASVACTMRENMHFSGLDNSLIPRSCSIANINSLSRINVLNLGQAIQVRLSLFSLKKALATLLE